MTTKASKIPDGEIVVIERQKLKGIMETADDNYDAGYTAALLQLRARIVADNPKQDTKIKKVLNHIQDLLGRCEVCGGWTYSDKSCLNCEVLGKANAKK